MNLNIDNICAIVVTYFPDSGFKGRLRKILEQVKQVIIIDNGTTGDSLSTIDMALQGKTDINLIKNGENLGIAVALNQGVRQALKYGFLWVVTFDQDSIPQPNMVKKMVEAWKAYPRPEKLMVVGCEAIFKKCPSLFSSIHDDESWAEVSYVITSGSLICKKAFEDVGYFNESLFIDYVDVEYCLRLKSRGYSIIQVHNALLLHGLGKITECNFFGRNVHPTHHNPVRRYYRFRNAILLHKAYKKAFPVWCKSNRIELLKVVCLIFLFEKRRFGKLIQIARGIRHGLLKRAGKRGEIPFSAKDFKKSDIDEL